MEGGYAVYSWPPDLNSKLHRGTRPQGPPRVAWGTSQHKASSSRRAGKGGPPEQTGLNPHEDVQLHGRGPAPCSPEHAHAWGGRPWGSLPQLTLKVRLAAPPGSRPPRPL